MNYDVLAISGSLRHSSFNTMVMRTLPELAPAGLSISGTTVAGVPLYNQDEQSQSAWPDAVEQLSDRIAAADGVIMVTPEYNYSVPGVLKNAIDWLSRRDPQPFRDKPVLIMGASPSGLGTSRAQYHLRQVLVFLEALTMPRPEVFISAVHEKVADGRLVDESTRQHVSKQLVAFANWIGRVGVNP